MKTQKIGWIGLGHMGTPMSTNLIKADYDLHVYNRTIEKTKSLTDLGAKACKTVDELLSKTDVIFSMLSDDNAVSAIYDELLNNDIKNKLFINMSTNSVEMSIELSKKIEAKGGRYLEAPVSGSVKPATDGQLVILSAGSNEEDYNQATSYFEKLGKLSLFLGKPGQGVKAKLAINYYMSVVIEGLAETVLFADKNGIDKETMMLIVNESACVSPMSQMKTASILQDNYPAAFPLKHMDKDINLAVKQGLETKTSEAMVDAYKVAMDANLGDEDLMAVIKSLKRQYFK